MVWTTPPPAVSAADVGADL